MRAEDEDTRTVYCGNLSEDVTEELLFELFNQAGPVESVRRPKEHGGRPKTFGFVLYKHECSVPYALELFRDTKLFNRRLNINSRSSLHHVPVLDTHLTEFTEPRDRHQERRGDHRSEGRSRHRHSDREKDPNAPKSWAELNALKGKGSLSNGQFRGEDLQRAPEFKTEPASQALPGMMDFNMLLQMGQQMMIPGMMGMMPMMGLGPSMGGINSYPSSQGRLSGGERRSPERDRRDRHEGRDGRRDHPYHSRGHYDHRDEHRRHDRGYSSSRSSHDRERRERRSR